MKKIAVLLADDHMLVREGLRALLEAEGDMTVVGEASTGREAVEMAHRLHPDVVVMDIGMPLLNGLEATRKIRKELPSTRVLILTAHSDDLYVRQVAEIGAAGYVIKQPSAEVLARAVREVDKGSTFFNPPLANWLRQGDLRAGAKATWSDKQSACLSPREMEVLQLIAESLANKQIAAELGISIKTVEKHRGSLIKKLDIHDTAGLARHAIATGVIENQVRFNSHQPGAR
jgi:DNA-binding NarL/FixJ family response regulator